MRAAQTSSAAEVTDLRWYFLPLALLALTLAACPEERPGVTKEIPPQRVPPAVSIEPAPAGPGVAPGGGGLVSRPAPPPRRP